MNRFVKVIANSGRDDGVLPPEVRIQTSEPGDAGFVAYMHGRYYWKHHGFHSASEYYFIKHLADFVNNPEGGRLWTVKVNESMIGSVAIVRNNSKTAQFRWFLVDVKYQGIGIGSRLMRIALDFCRENGYSKVILWTFKGLGKARRLYDKAGFVLSEEKENLVWSNMKIIEQKMELRL